MARPPLGLSINVRDASGAETRWHSGARNPENRPRNLSWSSQRMTGFATASMDLARRIDRDYVDAHLYDNVEIVGDDGSTVWDGRIGNMPRSADTNHTISLQCAGWMAHARDKKFVMPFVDRDVSRWTDVPQERKSSVLGSSISLGDLSHASAQGGVTVALPNQALGAQTLSEVWYTAPNGTKVSAVGYRGKTTTFPAGYAQSFYSTATRDAAAAVAAASTLDDTLRLATIAAPTRHVLHQVSSNGNALTPAAGSSVQFLKLAAYGNHGLTLRAGDPVEPSGVWVSDVLRWIIDNHCPLLSSAGIGEVNYVIQHLAYTDPTDPYDAFLDVNKFTLYDLSVWEDRVAHYTATDLTDYDWEVRLGDHGTSTTLQGDSTENLANGIAVTYTDLLTGQTERLLPTDHAELRDESVENPANQHGIQVWTEFTLGAQTLQASALQIGRAALAEFNQPQAPGSITVGPYVRDRVGHWQPYHRVRAGDRVAITGSTSLSDRPRVIHEVSQSQSPNGGGTATMAVDSTFKTLPAILDRLDNAGQASGR